MSPLFLLIIAALVCWFFAGFNLAQSAKVSWYPLGWFFLLLWWAIGHYPTH